MANLLLIATGGTIASKHTDAGLAPQITAEEILSYVPEASSFCTIETIQPFSVDSTNMSPAQWLEIAGIIKDNYNSYDGFVICHGTDTMAYTAAVLSYLIQNSKKPIVITGAQKPIDLPVTDARTNLLDSLRFASLKRSHGVNIIFDGKVICGTRAKKEYSKSYNAFASINYPEIAIIQENRIVYFIDDKKWTDDVPVKFYDSLNTNVFVMKLIPGIDGTFLREIMKKYDAVIIESFGVGGFPDYGANKFFEAVRDGLKEGKKIIMATQVTHEGSDMGIYKVGNVFKEEFDLVEALDMTLEATVTKTMWALAECKKFKDANPNTDLLTENKMFKDLFYTQINHDVLFADIL